LRNYNRLSPPGHPRRLISRSRPPSPPTHHPIFVPGFLPYPSLVPRISFAGRPCIAILCVHFGGTSRVASTDPRLSHLPSAAGTPPPVSHEIRPSALVGRPANQPPASASGSIKERQICSTVADSAFCIVRPPLGATSPSHLPLSSSVSCSGPPQPQSTCC